MPETFKSHFIQWAIAFSVLAIGGVTVWTLNMSALKTKFDAMEQIQIKRTEELDALQNRVNRMDVRTAEILKSLEANLKYIGRMDAKIASFGERMTLHADKDWHTRTGIFLSRLDQSINSLEKYDTEVNAKIEKLKDRFESMDVYTAKMAQNERIRIFDVITRIETKLQTDISRTDGQIGRVENFMLREIENLKGLLKDHVGGLHHKNTMMQPKTSSRIASKN